MDINGKNMKELNLNELEEATGGKERPWMIVEKTSSARSSAISSAADDVISAAFIPHGLRRAVFGFLRFKKDFVIRCRTEK